MSGFLMGRILALLMHGKSVHQIERGFWTVVATLAAVIVLAFVLQTLFPPAP